TLRSDRPYERADITGLSGVTEVGAVDQPEPVAAGPYYSRKRGKEMPRIAVDSENNTHIEMYAEDHGTATCAASRVGSVRCGLGGGAAVLDATPPSDQPAALRPCATPVAL